MVLFFLFSKSGFGAPAIHVCIVQASTGARWNNELRWRTSRPLFLTEPLFIFSWRRYLTLIPFFSSRNLFFHFGIGTIGCRVLENHFFPFITFSHFRILLDGVVFILRIESFVANDMMGCAQLDRLDTLLHRRERDRVRAKKVNNMLEGVGNGEKWRKTYLFLKYCVFFSFKVGLPVIHGISGHKVNSEFSKHVVN